ncbi:hypothetical protein C8R42DRAFT_660860 [Lentinula raphanica]|nr:hypothetical protein C8R42DRAFT_660860 [Lentinula raphanica]
MQRPSQTGYNVFYQPRTNLDFTGLYDKLRSNYGLTAHSKANVTDELTEIQTEIEDSEAELYRLQSHIAFLQSHRRHLDEYRDCLYSLISPIRKLPNELLLCIFEHACGMNHLTSGHIQSMPALAISGVCSHWRVLARTSPQLWSRIRVYLTMMHPDHIVTDLLQYYVDLSQQSPLSFEVLGEKLETLDSCQSTVCTTVGACSDRWKELTVSQPTFFKALTAHNPTHFPVLEELSISSFAFRLSGSLDRFQDAPKLHSLSISLFPLSKLPKSLFPWNQLNVLTICSYTEELKYLLEGPCNVTDLHFCEWADGWFKKTSTFPLLASSIQTMSLSVAASTQQESESLVDVIFSSMTCPNLTSLYIDRADIDDSYERIWPRSLIHDFLSRSACKLTTLSIKSIPLADSNIIDILTRLPSLLHLTIEDNMEFGGPITPQLIQSLNAFRYNGRSLIPSILAPKLHSLSLGFSTYDDSLDPALVEMVSSRRYPGGMTYDTESGKPFLRSVVFRFPNRQVIREANFLPLKYHEKAGLRVVVFEGSSVLRI